MDPAALDYLREKKRVIDRLSGKIGAEVYELHISFGVRITFPKRRLSIGLF